MHDSIEKTLKQSRQALDNMEDILEDVFDDLPEQAKELQGRSRAVLHKIAAKLDISLTRAENSAQEAQLQAHLGLMEAQDRLDASRPVIDEYLAQLADRSKTVMGEAELKARLAAMEAEDFWERRGQYIAAEFRESGEKMAGLASEAAEELQSRIKHWSDAFNRSDHQDKRQQ